MADARGLAEHLEHVVVPEAVERVAAVIARHGDANAPGRELVHEGHAPPARGAPGHAILQVQVAHRETDDADPGLGDEVERFRHGVGRLDGQAAAVTAGDPASEATAHHRARQVRQRPRADVAALVAVEVDVEPTLGGQVQHAVEQRVDLR